MIWIIAYDGWLRGRTTALLDWLYEWLSISQKVVERTLIGVYIVGSLVLVVASAMLVHSYLIPPILTILELQMVAMLIRYHRQPSTVRTALHRLYGAHLVRLFWQILALLALVNAVSHHPTVGNVVYDFSVVVLNTTYMTFLYVVASNCDGERGRRRKLAWSKLKELFSWLPDPVPSGA